MKEKLTHRTWTTWREKAAFLKELPFAFARSAGISVVLYVIGFPVLVALFFAGQVVYRHLAHHEEVIVVGVHNWMTGEIRPCELDGTHLHCGDDADAHVFSVEFNRHTSQKVSDWKCTRTPSSVSCELKIN